MELLQQIVYGFSISFQLSNLIYCFIGVLLGTLVGVLPGFSPPSAIALLIPITFTVPPVSAIIMVAGIYYGSMYGGSTTSILVNIPGEPSSVVTTFDGYQMALQGRAGPALGIAALGSFIAGTLGLIGTILVAPPLAAFALKFGPPEMFGVMILGITIVSYVARESIYRAVMTAALGIIISCVGTDLFSGVSRFTFGIPDLQEGLDLVPVVMGLYGITEILVNVEERLGKDVYEQKIKNLLPSLEDWRRSIVPILRGSGIGFLCGLLPGAGPTISSFISYGVEKKSSKNPEQFGKGAIEGVAAPESANNAATQAAFIPLLTLGVPTTVTAAIIFGALMIHGVTPGPLLISKHPDVFWGVITSMYVGNLMLLVLNLPLIGIWVKVLKTPYVFLFPIILMFCIVGAYSIRNSFTDVLIMLVFGLVGYFMRKFSYETAPMVMALVLGPNIEHYLKQALIISKGSFAIFYTRPISLIALSVAAFLLILPLLPWAKGKRPALGSEE